jgi:hypothetical protein
MKIEDPIMKLLAKNKEQIQLAQEESPAPTPTVTTKSITSEPTDDLAVRLKKLLESKPEEPSELASESENEQLEIRLRKILNKLVTARKTRAKYRENCEIQELETRLDRLMLYRDELKLYSPPKLTPDDRIAKIRILEAQYHLLKTQEKSGKNLEQIDQSLKFISDQLTGLKNEKREQELEQELEHRLNQIVKISSNPYSLTQELTQERKAHLYENPPVFLK